MAIGTSGVIEILFGANHKKSHLLMETVQATKIDISSVHDIEGSWLDDQMVEDSDVVDGSFGNTDKTRDIAS